MTETKRPTQADLDRAEQYFAQLRPAERSLLRPIERAFRALAAENKALEERLRDLRVDPVEAAKLRKAVSFLRDNWSDNDGAEGESVTPDDRASRRLAYVRDAAAVLLAPHIEHADWHRRRAIEQAGLIFDETEPP